MGANEQAQSRQDCVAITWAIGLREYLYNLCARAITELRHDNRLYVVTGVIIGDKQFLYSLAGRT